MQYSNIIRKLRIKRANGDWSNEYLVGTTAELVEYKRPTGKTTVNKVLKEYDDLGIKNHFDSLENQINATQWEKVYDVNDQETSGSNIVDFIIFNNSDSDLAKPKIRLDETVSHLLYFIQASFKGRNFSFVVEGDSGINILAMNYITDERTDEIMGNDNPSVRASSENDFRDKKLTLEINMKDKEIDINRAFVSITKLYPTYEHLSLSQGVTQEHQVVINTIYGYGKRK